MLVRCAVSSATTSSCPWQLAAPANAASTRASASARASCEAPREQASAQHAGALFAAAHAPSSVQRRTQHQAAGRPRSFARWRRSRRTCTATAAGPPHARRARDTACSCQRLAGRTAPANRRVLALPCAAWIQMRAAICSDQAQRTDPRRKRVVLGEEACVGRAATTKLCPLEQSEFECPAVRRTTAAVFFVGRRAGPYLRPSLCVIGREAARACGFRLRARAPHSLPWRCARRRVSCSATALPAS